LAERAERAERAQFRSDSPPLLIMPPSPLR
jgi:hypothetical protein